MAREPEVFLLMTASGSLDILLTRLLRMKLFRNFPSTRLQSYQQHHAAPEVALTVRSMSLKRKFRRLPLFQIVDFAKNAHASKLVAFKVLKNIICLSWKYS